MTEVAEEKKGSETTETCPNCGRPLFSGLAEGTVLVCRDGCSIAHDPRLPFNMTAGPAVPNMADVPANPELGTEPAVDTQLPPDQNLIGQPWKPPISGPEQATVVIAGPPLPVSEVPQNDDQTLVEVTDE